ncbi:hypothetical protein [Actinoallomurus rhizosphaericola]|uniref:hypothetical protein n=1 Tax=Actinoallomurus rhizosphaericola TaxID=2952536 RepID=UPI0020937BE2|nr:hypothetical protein [Actinoallomurus rhizosphaericola]MCO5996016.1 hypothetical protein [Actinoallomurus rhizosphaericola]
MNELDLMRTMRTDAPIPSQRRLDAGRERLLQAIDGSPGARRPVRAGRRSRGVRTMVLAAGGVAAVAAGVTVVSQTGGSPVTVHGSPAAVSARYDNPLVERAAFGWLPSGMHANGYVADRQTDNFFQVVAQKTGKSGGIVTLTAYAAGKEPFLGYLPGGVPAKRIPAPSVNGHSAYWIFKPDPSGQSQFSLRWQPAPNRWAQLEGDALPGNAAELARTANRIAASAKFGGTRPIAMPLHVGGVPAGLTPKRTVLNNGAFDQVSASLGFIVDGPSSDLEIGVTKSDGTVGTGVPGGPGKPGRGLPRPNTKLDGYPAYVAPTILYAYGVNGFNVQIHASGSILAKLNKTGGVTGLFHRLKVLGADPSHWTPTPVN